MLCSKTGLIEMKILVKVGDIEREIELVDCKTSRAILEKLPIKGYANRWGDEIYFTAPIDFDEEENSRDVVELGDVAFWIPGKAICIFFGKTPVSDDRIRPASPVNVFGRVKGDIEAFKSVKDGEEIFLYMKGKY
jgi:hypothetical protein